MTLLKHSLILVLASLLLQQAAMAQFFGKEQPVLLPENEAFKHQVTTDGRALNVFWSIADDYYMYRDQFSVSLNSNDAQVELNLVFAQQGDVENDPEFGNVEVYFFNAEIRALLPSDLTLEPETSYTVVLKGQGCNKPVGVCYPPMQRAVSLSWSAEQLASTTTSDSTAPVSSSKSKPTVVKSFWAYVLSAFGAGLLLSLTPCVLPMIPILSGVIAKQHTPSKLKAGGLACCYVAGTVVTYIGAGWLAGATGMQLQAHFQNPWVIGFVCLLLILLAASLFGAFKIQTPSSLQSKLHAQPSSSDSLLAVKSFALGLISALVVGACVSPILIVALGAAISQGDRVLGAAIMGSMALGMGVLLIVFGFGAGWVLPKTGAWMQQIQTLFGFMVLGVAIYIASALMAVPVLLLWALLLLSMGFYIWQLANIDSATTQPGLLASIGKALAVASLIWGTLALMGHATGGREILSPLSELRVASSSSSSIVLPFETTTTLSATKAVLEDARKNQQAVLVDFYADWCFDCVRMKRTTFKEPAVAAALSGWKLLVIDVTNTSADSEELKQYFDVFGPPATLFIDPKGEELGDLRQYGYIPSGDLINLVNNIGLRS